VNQFIVCESYKIIFSCTKALLNTPLKDTKVDYYCLTRLIFFTAAYIFKK